MPKKPLDTSLWTHESIFNVNDEGINYPLNQASVQGYKKNIRLMLKYAVLNKFSAQNTSVFIYNFELVFK